MFVSYKLRHYVQKGDVNKRDCFSLVLDLGGAWKR